MQNQKLVSVVIVSKDRKKDLIECLDSYFKSSYKKIEVIVVDNASRPPLLTWLPKKYPKVKLVTSHVNLGAAEGRNKGLELATGDFVLFADDDSYAEVDMIKQLVEAFEKRKDAGIIAPLLYDKQKKNMLQGAGHDIDLLTGRVNAWGVREEDRGQYRGLLEVPMCGCVWMVKREVFNKIGNYDKEYFIPYEDSDFSFRARKAGFKIYYYSEAKTWHQGKKSSYVHPWIEWLGITSPERAYRVARNKMIFMRKHSPFPQNLVFFFILLPAYTIAHSLIILSSRRFDILIKYWLGFTSGLTYCLIYPFSSFINRAYNSLDKKLDPLKIYLMGMTDPLPWVIDHSAKSILDLGCGQGKPMEMIKLRMKISHSVGVDLFEPYIAYGKANKIHDEYIQKDIRKVKFPPKSFDVVIASHVLEHMDEKDAWKVLENMERIAKIQVIIATPIGEHYHPAEDGNIWQLHKSAFTPDEFKKRGYKIKKYGWKWLLGDQGIVHKIDSDIIRKFFYALNIAATPIYYLFPPLCDYTFIAYKDVSEKV
ncbi:MAG: glycosyltransferase [Patescibacteria group bacterium]